jgi:hypothetical protein
MRLFAMGIERALDVPVRCAHDTNPRKHRRAAKLDHQNQRLDRGLPFREAGFEITLLGLVRHQANNSAPAGVNFT